MSGKTPFLLLLPLTFVLAACDDGQPAPPQTQEELMSKAVPVNAKAVAALTQETESLKAKRAEAKAELEKIRQQAASLNERAEALQNGDLAKASAGNTPDASIAAAAASEAAKNAPTPARAAPISKELEEKQIAFNLGRLCEAADSLMDISGKKSVTLSDVVGAGKPVPALSALAGETYEKLVFSPEQKTYQVTTADGRVISYTRGK